MSDPKDSFAAISHELKEKNVSLVAVSKTKPGTMIEDIYKKGQLDFGENYVQELVEKQEQLPEDIRWHFIGHLQRNKVKYIAPFVHLIQSVDSEKLLKEINKQALKCNRQIDCLLQLHIAEEDTKTGLDVAEFDALLPNLSQYTNIRIKGLMGISTLTGDQQQVRKEFKKLKTLFDRGNQSELIQNSWSVISMGMSADYKMAIEEGSTMVRIGSLLFGAR